MKANLRLALAASLPLMLVLTSSCSERPVEPTPAPAPPPPPPAPKPAPRVDWREAQITPGDWQWGIEDGKSVARFAGGQLTLRCDLPGSTVTMLRSGAFSGRIPVTILTQHSTRTLTGSGDPGAISVTFPARDPVLDAMAFSRGRFAVEVSGLPTLYVPSWPEVSRVIEDCR